VVAVAGLGHPGEIGERREEFRFRQASGLVEVDPTRDGATPKKERRVGHVPSRTPLIGAPALPNDGITSRRCRRAANRA
jgi:hypothetical protein